MSSFTLPSTATGSDGATLKVLMPGHRVAGQDDEPKVMKLTFNCIR